MSQTGSSSQIPIHLPFDVQSDRADLVESTSNRTAIAMIDSWPKWPGHVTILAGPVGSGKTHIANLWANKAEAIVVSADAIEKADLAEQLSGARNLLIEDMHDRFEYETTLFHILNMVREAGAYCLITSRSWPREWNISLNDLKSRLDAAQLIELYEPDDVLLKQVMAKLFSDRQLHVNANVIEYCALRMERSLSSAALLVETMDEIALSAKSTITKNTAAAALEKLNMN